MNTIKTLATSVLLGTTLLAGCGGAGGPGDGTDPTEPPAATAIEGTYTSCKRLGTAVASSRTTLVVGSAAIDQTLEIYASLGCGLAANVQDDPIARVTYPPYALTAAGSKSVPAQTTGTLSARRIGLKRAAVSLTWTGDPLYARQAGGVLTVIDPNNPGLQLHNEAVALPVVDDKDLAARIGTFLYFGQVDALDAQGYPTTLDYTSGWRVK